MGYRYLSTSRGDGNEITKVEPNFSSRECIDTYLPREGTETFGLISLWNHWFNWYRYLSTSRGDGNCTNTQHCVFHNFVQIPIYLERGRKLFSFTRSIRVFIQVYLPIHLERGRKHAPTFLHDFSILLYSSLSTSRGDGISPIKPFGRK